MPDTPRRHCTGTNKQGEPCGAAPLKDQDVCLAHADEEARVSTGFGINGGRPPKPRVVDVIRERIEEDIEEILAPLFDGLTATRGIALAIKGGGMEIGYMPDHETRIKAARELLDRAYGKPKQTAEVTGTVTQNHRIDLARLSDEDLAEFDRIVKQIEA